jgi:hypothetical protein
MTVPAPEGTPPADSTPPEPDGTPTPPAPDGEEQDTPLHRALVAERAEVKRLKAELKERETQDEQARRAAMTDQERALAEAKDAARRETVQEYDARILKLRVQAKAADFHDPDLVSSLLDLDADAKDDEIDRALADLAKERPYLVKAPGVRPMPQGPRSGSKSGDDVTGDDWLRQMVDAKRNG